MKYALIIGICLLLIVAFLPARQESDGGVFRVRDGKTVSFETMMDDLRTADIIYIGELHDEPELHRLELDIIQALHETDTSFAVGLEMFRAESQKTLDAWVGGTLSLERFLPDYYENWRMPWPLYRDIFLYTREHRIPLIGLNIPDSISDAVAKKGFDALPEKLRKQLPPGLSCNVDPAYQRFIRDAYRGHEHRSSSEFLHFCEAQQVWDKSMAFYLLNYRKHNPGMKVAVLTGFGHAWRKGIPAQVAEEATIASRVVLPMGPVQGDPRTAKTSDADYLLSW
ncbi:MAG: ChaN family lipoprotein [Nitrospiraceae bacterium]|nr:ChaN family lipoprotein [Nitrospiraceae bacterium]